MLYYLCKRKPYSYCRKHGYTEKVYKSNKKNDGTYYYRCILCFIKYKIKSGKINDRFADNKKDYVLCRIHGYTEDIYKGIRGNGKIYRNCKRCCINRVKMNDKKNYI